ncbi:MAG TPA: 50S ribosomal protein L21 [Candidatus Paceibacterota bacterium]|nr:50S ribosomal protein L21 [Candidatus Paceibacterota bacterium]
MAEMAVIKTGGKQYVVTPGKKLKIEKLPVQEGSDVVFEEVLLLEGQKGLEIGAPLVQGAKVQGKILKQAKAKKVVIFKFKAKKREKKKRGHRQPYSEVQITSIEAK